MAEKMRVHILAKELNVRSKVIIDKCKAEGIDVVKNHMSTLSAGLHATIREWFSEGSHDNTLETAQRVELKKVRIAAKRKTKHPAQSGAAAAVSEPDVATTDVVVTAPETAIMTAPAIEKVEINDDGADTGVEIVETLEAPPVVEEAGTTEVIVEALIVSEPKGAAPYVPTEAEPSTVETEAKPPPASDEQPSDAAPTEPKPPEQREQIKPAGPQNVPAAAKLQGPRVVHYEALEHDTYQRRPREPVARESSGTSLTPPPKTGPTTEKTSDPRKDRGRSRRTGSRLSDAGERLAAPDS